MLWANILAHYQTFFLGSFYEVGWCDSVPVWVPGWQSRCQRPTKDGLLLPKGAVGPSSASFRCGHKSDNRMAWHASLLSHITTHR